MRSPRRPSDRPRGRARTSRRPAALAAVGGLVAAGLVVATAVVLTQPTDRPGPGAGPSASPAASPEPTATHDVPPPESDVEEESSWSPRLVVAHDAGLLVLDAVTFDVLADLPLDGVTDVAPAGDGRHVLAGTPDGFRVVDVGTFADAHGDHAHYYTRSPRVTDVVWPAAVAGAATNTADTTVLLDAGTGEAVVLPEPEVALGPDSGYEADHVATGGPHPGAVVALDGGGLVATEGTPDGVTGVRLLAADGTEVARTPCTRDRALVAATAGAVVLACSDGAVVATPDGFREVTGIGRVAAVAGSPASTTALAVLAPAAPDEPSALALLDTGTASVRPVALPAVAGPVAVAAGRDGELVALTADGVLHVVDATSGAVTTSVPAVQPWDADSGPEGAVPALTVLYGSAVVTDPTGRRVVAVDLGTGTPWASAELSATPRAVVAVSGDMELTPGP